MCFFVRDDCFSKSFEAVRNARPSKLLLWQDGPRNEKDKEGIMKCREIAENTKLETLSWHFYDIYYSLSGGELESSRDDIYIKA